MGVLRLRDTAVALLATLSCLALLASCSSSPATPVQHSFASQIPTAAPGPSWAPKGVTTNGLTSLATSDHAHGFRLHTVSGDKTFIPGMNLGSTTPLHQPGELAIGASDYHRWFAEMGAMGVRAVRIYTIHPPAFYNELAAYDTAHPDAPIY